MLEVNQIYTGDCVEVMKSLDDDSVDLVVTSPPYDNLRTYHGFEFDFESIAKELYRVVKKGCVVVWVVGDATIKGSETGTSFRQALYFKEIGFNLYDTMIYAKIGYVPLTHNRYEQSFEFMFALSKGRTSVFNPIMIPTKKFGIKYYRGINSKEKEGSYSTRNREETTITKKEKQHPNIFYYHVGNNVKSKHNAPFPYDLVKDQISSWCVEGALVLDPMCGSGTTCRAAKELNRNYIGIEISPKYATEARNLLGIKEDIIMDWGCCDQPNLQWNFMGDTADLKCQACGESWTPVHSERPIHTEALSSNGANHLDDGTYQAAWKTLLTRVGEKTSWGKNLLRDLMLDVLTNPDSAEYPNSGLTVEEVEKGAVGIVELAVEVYNSTPNPTGATTTDAAPVPVTVTDSDQVTETVEESLAGVYPWPDQPGQ